MSPWLETSETTIRKIDLGLSPVEVARRLVADGSPDLVFLDSSSLDALADDTTIASQPGARISLIAAGAEEVVTGQIFNASDRSRLQKVFSRYEYEDLPLDLGFPLGGAFGTIDYDGTFRFGMYRDTLVFDHRTETWIETGKGELACRVLAIEAAEEVALGPIKNPKSGSTGENYCQMVDAAREYIAAGDIYQVNLSHRFCTGFDGIEIERFALYERLRSASPAPYAAFLDEGGRQVLSSSPELFLSMSGKSIRTRPIKGTRPRFADQKLDEKSAYDLRTSPKEIAELIMITDLERNDLGQICEFGSVEATDLLKLERYEQVFHLVSTVEGLLREDVGPIEALTACYPGGSITGAPKKRAREIISELESEARGLYTGAIGGFGFNGESRFSIAIRTAIIEDGELHFHAGAGIVADSDPEAEYIETLHKAAGIIRACLDSR